MIGGQRAGPQRSLFGHGVVIGDEQMRDLDLAVEFTDLWKSLETGQINTMLARNVSMDLLEFFENYAREFAEECAGEGKISDETQKRLPNLLIIGYIIRVLEERVS